MMLAVENPGTGALEIAILLDEAPTPNFHLGGDMYEQPCMPHSKLAEAILTSYTDGYAWLYIVYQGDDPATWGSRQVKVTAERKLYTYQRTKLGNRKPVFAAGGRAGPGGDGLMELRYRLVAPDLFHIHAQLNVPSMLTKSHKYKAFIQADCKLDPGLGLQVRDEEEHELLGHPERIYQDVPGETQNSIFVHPDLGTHVKWIAENGQGEEWFLQDKSGFENYRFELTEFQRRPFVQFVLAILAFVMHPTITQSDSESDKNKVSKVRRIMFSTLVRGIHQRVHSLTTILLDSLPSSVLNPKCHRPKSSTASNSKSLPPPAPPAASSRASERMEMVQDDDDDQDDSTGSEINVVLPEQKPMSREITHTSTVQQASAPPTAEKRSAIVSKISLKGLTYDKSILKRKKSAPAQSAVDNTDAQLTPPQPQPQVQPEVRSEAQPEVQQELNTEETGSINFQDTDVQEELQLNLDDFDAIEIDESSSDDDNGAENEDEKNENQQSDDDGVLFEF